MGWGGGGEGDIFTKLNYYNCIRGWVRGTVGIQVGDALGHKVYIFWASNLYIAISL